MLSMSKHLSLSDQSLPSRDGQSAVMTAELANLLDQHHDLDVVITVLLEAGSDDLLVSRFKKRKLQIKDQIAAASGRGLMHANAA